MVHLPFGLERGQDGRSNEVRARMREVEFDVEPTITAFPLPKQSLLDSVSALLDAREQHAAAAMVRDVPFTVEQTGWDNWDGGIDLWSLIFSPEIKVYAARKREFEEELAGQIVAAASEIIRRFHRHGIQGAQIVPRIDTTGPSAGHAISDEELERHLVQLLSSRGLDLDKEIGRGAYGIVFRARHRFIGDDRAVKVFSPSPLATGTSSRVSKALARFVREAKVLGRVRSPHIARVLDADLDGELKYIITEFCTGTNLQDHVAAAGAVPLPVGIRVVEQLLDGLAEVHAASIAHRDIAPKNVILDPTSGKVSLIDFGLSGFLEERLEERLTSQELGTPGFIAPELLHNPKLQDLRVDIFSVGALFHWMLTGRPPDLSQPENILAAIAVPPNVRAVAGRALALRPEQRFRSAAEMRLAMESARGSQPSPAGVETTPNIALLSEQEVVELLQINRAKENEQVRAVVRAALQILNQPPPREYAAIEPAYIATLLCGLAQLAEKLTYGQDWQRTLQDQEDFRGRLAQLLGLRSGRSEAANAGIVHKAIVDAANRRWLEQREHDTWHPGMASGSGWRSIVGVTPLGRRLLQRAGIPVGLAGAG